MRVSRNKCELLAEYCLTGVKPVHIGDKDYVKDMDITDITCVYLYISYRYASLELNKDLMQCTYFENATQMIYLALNENLVKENYMHLELTELEELAEKEIKQIRKYRETEEDLTYV